MLFRCMRSTLQPHLLFPSVKEGNGHTPIFIVLDDNLMMNCLPLRLSRAPQDAYPQDIYFLPSHIIHVILILFT